MKVIKQISRTQDDVASAQVNLAALQALPGFVFGYVDEQKVRCITFHSDTHPGMTLQSGQQRVELSFSLEPQTVQESDMHILKPIGDAIIGAKIV